MYLANIDTNLNLFKNNTRISKFILHNYTLISFFSLLPLKHRVCLHGELIVPKV